MKKATRVVNSRVYSFGYNYLLLGRRLVLSRILDEPIAMNKSVRVGQLTCISPVKFSINKTLGLSKKYSIELYLKSKTLETNVSRVSFLMLFEFAL